VAKPTKTTAPGEADLDALYEGDLGGFTARRNALAKRLTAAGDREAAARAKALRKPSRAAWAVNRLSREEPKLRDLLLSAGEALRAEQQKLVAGRAEPGGARAAADEERRVVGEMVDAAQAAARADDAALSAAAVERVRQTLHAVALDDEVRAQFERGRLTEEHQAVGLGPLSAGPAADPGAERRATKRRREELEAAVAHERDLRRREAAAERELEQATRDADRAQARLQAATAAHEEARDAAERATAQVKELRAARS